MKTEKKRDWTGMIFSALLFVIVFVMLAVGTSNLSGSTNREGRAATQQAIERAAVLCYATEGFYPPSLGYIEERYGVQIDHKKYAVRYNVFASNIMPDIRVASW